MDSNQLFRVPRRATSRRPSLDGLRDATFLPFASSAGATSSASLPERKPPSRFGGGWHARFSRDAREPADTQDVRRVTAAGATDLLKIRDYRRHYYYRDRYDRPCRRGVPGRANRWRSEAAVAARFSSSNVAFAAYARAVGTCFATRVLDPVRGPVTYARMCIGLGLNARRPTRSVPGFDSHVYTMCARMRTSYGNVLWTSRCLGQRFPNFGTHRVDAP